MQEEIGETSEQPNGNSAMAQAGAQPENNTKELRSSSGRFAHYASWTATVGLMMLLLAGFARFYQPGYGFTYVEDFGDTGRLKPLPEVKSTPVYVHPGVPGYDGEYYAQIALRPSGTDSELLSAIDTPPYRARRILLPWLAWLLGGGSTSRVLNAYALLNPVAWLALAVLTWRWFPPGRLDTFLRWAGVMFSAGMLASLRHALTDGPALLLLAAAVALLETRRRWPACGSLALSMLTRETSALGAIAFAPAEWRSWRAWRSAALFVFAACVPLVAWIIHLRSAWHVELDGGGVQNFTWPLAAYFGRWRAIAEDFEKFGWTEPFLANLCLHVGITVQALWIVARPRWSSIWWRVGAMHVLLLVVLNTPVWEGYSGASSRVLLPLLLAFNIVVPRSALGIALLIAGNLTVVAGIGEMTPPRPTWRVDGPKALVSDARNHGRVEVQYVSGFYGPEADGKFAWRWSSGKAVWRITNPHAFPLMAHVHLGMRGTEPRRVALTAGETVLWRGPVGAEIREMELPEFVVPPGGIDIELDPGGEGSAEDIDQRKLAIALFNVNVKLSAAPAGPRP